MSGPVDLKAWKYQNRLVADYLPSHLRVVRFRFPFAVRAERTVRFYDEYYSWQIGRASCRERV